MLKDYVYAHDYPYTNFHEMNLDWILGQMIELRSDMRNFVNQNTIKYADPIQWNITTQYEGNTVVIDPNTGNAYISSQPVPAGVSLSNEDYWSNIGNFEQLYTSIKESIAAADDHNNTNASAARIAGSLLWLNDTLYKVLSNISVGGLYITSGESANLEPVTIEELLTTLDTEYAELAEIVENLAVSSIYENVAAMVADEKLVNGLCVATSGFYTKGDSGAAYYMISDTGSADEHSIIALDNGKYAHLIVNRDKMNIRQYGYAGTGLEDVTSFINGIVGTLHCLVIAKGRYKLTNTITLSNITIEGECDTNNDSYAVLFTEENIDVVKVNSNTVIKNITIEHSAGNTNHIIDVTNARYVTMEYVKLQHDTPCIATGIYSGDMSGNNWCGYLYFNNVKCSDYAQNVRIRTTFADFINCKLNGATTRCVNLGNSEVVNFTGCDFTSDSFPAISYDGKYGVNCNGCYFEDYHYGDIFRKAGTSVFANIKNNGCKIMQPETANSFDSYSMETYWHKNGGSPDMIGNFNNGLDGLNRVKNGCFAYGTHGWEISYNDRLTVTIQDLAEDLGIRKCAKLQFTSSSRGDFTQEIGYIRPGIYTLDFWILFSDFDADNIDFSAWLSAGYSSTNYAARIPITSNNIDRDIVKNQWRHVVVPFKIDTDNSVSNFRIRFGATNTVSTCYITGVGLYPGITTHNDDYSPICQDGILARNITIEGDDGNMYKIHVNNSGVLTATQL